MSKLEQILGNNGRSLYFRRKVGGLHAGVLFLTLSILLFALVFMTQPQVRDAVGPLLAQIPGL